MYIRVLESGELALQDCDNLRAFSIVPDTVEAPLTKLQAFAEVAEDNHYWLDAEAVEALSPRRDDPRWIESFRAMLAGVADYGYYDAKNNRVKAHVEYADNQD